MVRLKTYTNGLRLIVENMPQFRSISCGIMVAVGSAYENDDNNGISHFIEHMNFKGTKTRTSTQIAEEFDALGANSNAFTSREYTCFYYKCIDEVNEKCFDVLSDTFINSVYDDAEIARESKVVAEEINMSEDDPDGLCYDVLMQAHYGANTALGRTILGNSKNVLSFTKEDILAFKSEHYKPSDTIIAFTGNITLEQAEQLLEKYMLDFTQAECKKHITYPKVTTLPLEKKTRAKDFEQSTLSMGFNSVSFNDFLLPVQSIMDGIIGGGSSSRLFQRLREQMGLVYSVYSYAYVFEKSGVFTISLNVNPANIEKSLVAISDEMKKLIENGVTDKEVNKIKMQLKTSALFAYENPRNYLFSMLRYLTLGDKFYEPETIMAQVNAVTTDKVNDFIKKYLSTTPSMAYVGKKVRSSIIKY